MRSRNTPRLAAALLVLATPLAAQRARRVVAPPLRLMPLGDSITQGGQGFASWRYPLWFSLPTVPALDFVGEQTTVFGGDGGGNPDTSLYPSYYTAFDRDHEGWWGYRTDQIDALVFAAAEGARPDIVLVHLGTNDVGQMGVSGVANVQTYLPRILGHVRAVRPAATFVLAQVVPIGPGTGYFTHAGEIPALNSAIAAIAAAEHVPASPVVLVDQFTGFDLGIDMQIDGLHPDVSGEDRMAATWLTALEAHLHPPRPPREAAASVLDPSFEAIGLADQQVVEQPPGTPWRFGATPSTFRGLFNPGSDTYTGAAGTGTPAGADGDDVAYLYDNGSGAESVVLFQTLATTFEPGKTLTLRVAVGNRLPTNPYGPSTWGGFRIELLAGNEVVGRVADAFVPTPGTFQDATLLVSSDALAVHLLGQALTVRMRLTDGAPGSATDFDHVRLTAE